LKNLARGKTRKKAKWEAYMLSKLETKGRLIGAMEAEKRKPMGLVAREYFGKVLDKIDPLEATSIIGTTIIIKQGIDWTQYALPKLAQLAPYLPHGLGFPIKQFEKLEGSKLVGANVALEWLLSFSIAYIVVRYFDKVVEAGKNIIGIARGLLGTVTG